MSLALVVRINELEKRIEDLELLIAKLLSEAQTKKEQHETKRPYNRRNPGKDSG